MAVCFPVLEQQLCCWYDRIEVVTAMEIVNLSTSVTPTITPTTSETTDRTKKKMRDVGVAEGQIKIRDEMKFNLLHRKSTAQRQL